MTTCARRPFTSSARSATEAVPWAARSEEQVRRPEHALEQRRAGAGAARAAAPTTFARLPPLIGGGPRRGHVARPDVALAGAALFVAPVEVVVGAVRVAGGALTSALTVAHAPGVERAGRAREA